MNCWVIFSIGKGIFIFTTVPGRVLKLTQWLSAILSSGLRWPEREVNHKPSNAEVKNAWNYTVIRLHINDVCLSIGTLFILSLHVLRLRN
jgi:hypothetical protein